MWKYLRVAAVDQAVAIKIAFVARNFLVAHTVDVADAVVVVALTALLLKKTNVKS